MEEYSKLIKQTKKESDLMTEMTADIGLLKVHAKMCKIPTNNFDKHPIPVIDKLVLYEESQLTKLFEEKSVEKIIMYEKINEVENEFEKVLEYQLNCQLLNEKPYLVGIAVDYNKIMESYEEDSKSNDLYRNYFETVERHTTLKLNKSYHKFDKLIVNNELEYFCTSKDLDLIDYKSIL